MTCLVDMASIEFDLILYDSVRPQNLLDSIIFLY